MMLLSMLVADAAFYNNADVVKKLRTRCLPQLLPATGGNNESLKVMRFEQFLQSKFNLT